MVDLSPHERQFLLLILEDGALSNTEIAERLGVSPTAARKIRLKLERTGILQGYRPVLNLGALGIQVFALVEVRLLPKGWSYNGGQGIQSELIRHENVLAIYRLPEGQVTHLVLTGFRNMEEEDRFFHVLQSQYCELLEIHRSYTLSGRSILKEDPRTLLTKILLEGPQARLPRGFKPLVVPSIAPGGS
jgi:DNA-binding Lrp family transcriptional regulator